MRVRTVGKQKCNAHNVATHAHAEWPKATYSRKMTDSTADVGAHASGRSQSQHVRSTHECQIYIIQQNQLPIHRTTIERPAAVENLKKHRPQTQKPSNPLASAPHAAPAAAPSLAPSGAAAAPSFDPSYAAAAAILLPLALLPSLPLLLPLSVGSGGRSHERWLLRDEMRSAGNVSRVDHSVCRAGSVARDVHRLKLTPLGGTMLAHIRR
jgi:hypothetical protein